MTAAEKIRPYAGADLIDRKTLRFSRGFNDDGILYVPYGDIAIAPTVDAVPVIHAHPIFNSKLNHARCSNCGKYCIGYDDDNWDRYCCCCGAKLDESIEKEKEEE